MFENITVTTKEKSTVEITGELPVETVTAFKEKALQALGKDAELPGFRKGHVPADMLEKHIDPERVWHKAAELALADTYPKIVKEKELDAIGRPHITITKLAPNNPLGFRILTAVLPNFDLPDYKTIAHEHTLPDMEALRVTDAEFEKALTEIRQRIHDAEKAHKASEKEAQQEDVPIIGDSKKDGELPELTDDFVKKLGAYENVADFKEKLRAQMKENKMRIERDKWRMNTIEAIVAKTKLALPDLIVDSELAKMLAQFKSDVGRAGMTFEDYLKQINKTEIDLKKEWRPDAEKRAQTQMLLNTIAKEEEITPEEKDVEHEVNHILSHHKDADRETLRIYVTTLLTNEQVFQWLEKESASKTA